MIKLKDLLDENINEFIADKKDIKNYIGTTVTIQLGGKKKDVVLSDMSGDMVYLMTPSGKSGKVPVSKFLSMVEGKINESSDFKSLAKKLVGKTIKGPLATVHITSVLSTGRKGNYDVIEYGGKYLKHHSQSPVGKDAKVLLSVQAVEDMLNGGDASSWGYKGLKIVK